MIGFIVKKLNMVLHNWFDLSSSFFYDGLKSGTSIDQGVIVSSACSNDFLAESRIISKIRQELCWSDFYPTHTDLVRVHRMFHRVDAPFFLRVCCVFYYDWFFVTVAVHRFLMNLQKRMVSLDRVVFLA